MSFAGVGFGYKIAWLAVKDRVHGDIAEVLGIKVAGQQDWGVAVDSAYADGWLITPSIDGWTLVASTRAFMDEDVEMAQRVAELSQALGEVQYFATHRVVEYHAWAHARDGEMVRAFAYLGERGQTLCNSSDGAARTAIECDHWPPVWFLGGALENETVGGTCFRRAAYWLGAGSGIGRRGTRVEACSMCQEGCGSREDDST